MRSERTGADPTHLPDPDPDPDPWVSHSETQEPVSDKQRRFSGTLFSGEQQWRACRTAALALRLLYSSSLLCPFRLILYSAISQLPLHPRLAPNTPILSLLLFCPALLFLLQNCQMALAAFTLTSWRNNSREPRQTAPFCCSS